jgi:benzoyl-CoA reductase/2-hydroxyglutaryl-CoA dehydratase subunit BcrC/BadD/HgdB
MRECRSTNARTKVFRGLYQVRSERPDILNSFDYFTLSYLSFSHPPESWLSLALPVLHETFRAAENSVFPGLRRVLLAGAPIIFPNYKLLEVLENAGCLIGADMLCSAYGRLYDPVEVDEDTERGIIRALALRYIGGSLCPCFVNSGKLNDAAINLVREYGLDGVVYHNLRLCQPYDIRLTMMRQATKKENIPFLSIKTDFGQEDIGQLKTRVEAFLEVLTAQNK